MNASICLNPYCVNLKISLDELTSISKVIKQGDFMTVSELDSGYWHVPIPASHHTYLGLHFEHTNGEVEFRFWTFMT